VNNELINKIDTSTDLNLFLENINETVKVMKINKDTLTIKVKFLKEEFKYIISNEKALIKYLNKIWSVNVIA
jgi:hypothetical protein